MQEAIIFTYKNNRIAQLTSSFNYDGDRCAYIAGTRGQIKLHFGWHRALKISIYKENDKKEIKFKKNEYGLNYQVDHVNQCLKKGQTESNIMPLDESISIMDTMDKLRKQWNFKYPMEK